MLEMLGLGRLGGPASNGRYLDSLSRPSLNGVAFEPSSKCPVSRCSQEIRICETDHRHHPTVKT